MQAMHADDQDLPEPRDAPAPKRADEGWFQRRYLDLLGSIYIYNEHRGYTAIARVLDAVRAHVTLGEVCDVFREEFGIHRDPAFL